MAEFISALAGGNNAQLMVEVRGSTAGSTTLGLVAAARQTGGRVVCILPGPNELEVSRSELSNYSGCIEFVIGDPISLLTNGYKGADFVVVDCNINSHGAVLKAVQKREAQGLLFVGYNAQHRVPLGDKLGGHFLPIGEGLLVSKVAKNGVTGGGLSGKKSKWVVTVDKCTGEEHVFRVTCPQHKVIQA